MIFIIMEFLQTLTPTSSTPFIQDLGFMYLKFFRETDNIGYKYYELQQFAIGWKQNGHSLNHNKAAAVTVILRDHTGEL